MGCVSSLLAVPGPVLTTDEALDSVARAPNILS